MRKRTNISTPNLDINIPYPYLSSFHTSEETNLKKKARPHMHVKNEIHRKYHITQELERAIKKRFRKIQICQVLDLNDTTIFQRIVNTMSCKYAVSETKAIH